MNSLFLAIAGGQTKTADQLKKDLHYDHLAGELRNEQNNPGFKRIVDNKGKKVYHIAGVDVSETDAEAALAAMQLNLPKEYQKYRTPEEIAQREREAFERRFGVNFDEAIDDLIEQDKKDRNKSGDQTTYHSSECGPYEGFFFFFSCVYIYNYVIETFLFSSLSFRITFKHAPISF